MFTDKDLKTLQKIYMKKIVHYKPSPHDIIIEGQRATLWDALDHTSLEVSNTPNRPVSTSKVVRIHERYFETLNTFYIPNGSMVNIYYMEGAATPLLDRS